MDFSRFQDGDDWDFRRMPADVATAWVEEREAKLKTLYPSLSEARLALTKIAAHGSSSGDDLLRAYRKIKPISDQIEEIESELDAYVLDRIDAARPSRGRTDDD